MTIHLPSFRIRDERGRVVLRDGLVFCFFMRRSHGEIAAGVWRALQAYRRATPPDALAWYVKPDGKWDPLGDEGWASVREEILETPWPTGSEVRLQESHEEVGAYSVEYSGKWLDAPAWKDNGEAVSAVVFTLATDFLQKHGPGAVRALALEMVAELPLSFGYAGLGCISPGGLRSPAKKALHELCLLCPGLDVYNLRPTARSIGTRARGAYWLTFLGQPLLGQLGGTESLRECLPSGISLEPLEGERLCIRLGEWPLLGDAQSGDDMTPYRALAHVLEPYFYEERTSWLIDEALERRWMHRFKIKRGWGT
ncbi:type VI immunity family protein [Stigmatella hybrida]|uniref:type VI immunity family protein n=1 Tax=Stigmatella hybrida TaxID=394097 RepID=UPI001CDB3128|nr:type VI immunity family protein [Stigmatella hybrida]